MAGPGGGPHRRSHTKSRKGCKTCKRRHIRCDETFPQCRNCTKHNCRCDYMDGPRPRDKRARSPSGPDLLWSPAIKKEIDSWRRTEQFPFPEMQVEPQPMVQNYSITDLRLMHHLCSITRDMQLRGTAPFVVWTDRIPTLLRIATVYPFVMHALLALSATHLAWLTDSQATYNIAYHHREAALRGLQDGIGNFRRDNSDAVLAASILLSWQSSDWRGWSSLMHGTSTVIDAMQSWKLESHFADFMDEQPTFPRAPSSPLPLDPLRPREARQEDLNALQHAHRALRTLEGYVAGKDEESKRLTELISFVRSLRSFLPVTSAAQQFELLQPLRAWLFWLPISFLQRPTRDASVLLVLAHFYAVALALGPVFTEIGASYFGSMSIAPIEEIVNTLTRMQESQPIDEDQPSPLTYMQFPLEMVADFRARMGWSQHSPLPYPPMPIIHSPYSYASVELHTDSDLSDYPLDLSVTSYSHSREASHVPSSPSIAGSGHHLMRGRPSPIIDPYHHHLDPYSPRSYPSHQLVGSMPSYAEEEHHLAAYSPTCSEFSPAVYAPPALWA
ncbi:MAG: hypothetical protein M1826_005915 [Phylliscum demangeonii]|nr:MAG: hypothetical protein M1826_005915 [Phylliscum demangeonii]